MSRRVVRPVITTLAVLILLALQAVSTAKVSAQAPRIFVYPGLISPSVATSTAISPAIANPLMFANSVSASGYTPVVAAAASSGPAATYGTAFATTTAYSAANAHAGYGVLTDAIDVTQNLRIGTILTDERGMTFYMLNNDGSGVSTCTDACSSVWPPAWAPQDSIQLGSTLPGSLGATARGDDTWQLTYNGKPLYFFAQDVFPGDAHGQGVTDQWGTWAAARP